MSDYRTISLFLCLLGIQTLTAQSLPEALEAMWLGNYGQAEKTYATLQSQDAANGRFTLLLSNALLAQGKKQEAQAALEKQKDPAWINLINLRLQLLRGSVQEDLKKIIARELRSKSGDQDYMTLMGQSYLFTAQEPETAIKYLTGATDAGARSFSSLMNLGAAFAYQRKFGDAVTQFEFAAASNAKSPLPWYLIGRIYQAARNTNLFLENMQKAIAAAPAYSPAYRDLGDYFYAQKDYAQARQWYEKLREHGAAAMTVEDKLQYVNILFLTKDYNATVKEGNQLLQSNPDRIYLERVLGYAYYELGDDKLAAEKLTRFLQKTSPDKILVSDYEYLGDVYKKEGQDSLAIVAYTEAIGMEGGQTVELYGKAAETCFKLKAFEQAAKYYQLRISKLPQPNAQDYFELGRAHFSGKQYVEADSAFAMIVRLRPDAVTGYLWRAKSNARLEPDIEANPDAKAEYGKAKPHFEEFIRVATASKDPSKLKKDLIDAYTYLAFYYFLMENDTEAVANANKITELDPENAYARDLIKTISEGEGKKN